MLQICLLSFLISHVLSKLNLYLDSDETQRLLGLRSQLFYVRNGSINHYATRFRVLIPPNIKEIKFTWQNLDDSIYKIPYSISFPGVKHNAMLEPTLNISPSGYVPIEKQVFSIELTCLPKMTAEVDFDIVFNVSIFGIKNFTDFKLARKKICVGNPDHVDHKGPPQYSKTNEGKKKLFSHSNVRVDSRIFATSTPSKSLWKQIQTAVDYGIDDNSNLANEDGNFNIPLLYYNTAGEPDIDLPDMAAAFSSSSLPKNQDVFPRSNFKGVGETQDQQISNESGKKEGTKGKKGKSNNFILAMVSSAVIIAIIGAITTVTINYFNNSSLRKLKRQTKKSATSLGSNNKCGHNITSSSTHAKNYEPMRDEDITFPPNSFNSSLGINTNLLINNTMNNVNGPSRGMSAQLIQHHKHPQGSCNGVNNSFHSTSLDDNNLNGRMILLNTTTTSSSHSHRSSGHAIGKDKPSQLLPPKDNRLALDHNDNVDDLVDTINNTKRNAGPVSLIASEQINRLQHGRVDMPDGYNLLPDAQNRLPGPYIAGNNHGGTVRGNHSDFLNTFDRNPYFDAIMHHQHHSSHIVAPTSNPIIPNSAGMQNYTMDRRRLGPHNSNMVKVSGYHPNVGKNSQPTDGAGRHNIVDQNKVSAYQRNLNQGIRQNVQGTPHIHRNDMSSLNRYDPNITQLPYNKGNINKNNDHPHYNYNQNLPHEIGRPQNLVAANATYMLTANRRKSMSLDAGAAHLVDESEAENYGASDLNAARQNLLEPPTHFPYARPTFSNQFNMTGGSSYLHPSSHIPAHPPLHQRTATFVDNSHRSNNLPLINPESAFLASFLPYDVEKFDKNNNTGRLTSAKATQQSCLTQYTDNTEEDGNAQRPNENGSAPQASFYNVTSIKNLIGGPGHSLQSQQQNLVSEQFSHTGMTNSFSNYYDSIKGDKLLSSYMPQFVPLNQIQIGNLVVEGTFGALRNATVNLNSFKMPAMIKIIKANCGIVPAQQALMINESAFHKLGNLQHPNILALWGFSRNNVVSATKQSYKNEESSEKDFISNANILIYCDIPTSINKNNDHFDIMNDWNTESHTPKHMSILKLYLSQYSETPENLRKYQLTTKDFVHFSLQLLNGLEYIHHHSIIHKDISARNCFLTENMCLKIGDTSLARDIFAGDYCCLGDNDNRPIKWMALESLLFNAYSTYSDLWSFGVTMWEIISLGAMPYYEIDPYEMSNYLQNGYRLSQPTHCPDELYSIILSCMRAAPESRPSCDVIRESLTAFQNTLDRFI